MIDLLRFVSGLAADLVRRHGELVAENALLRQQLIVAHRTLCSPDSTMTTGEPLDARRVAMQGYILTCDGIYSQHGFAG